MASTFRGKATNIASRGSRVQSIPGFRLRGHCDRLTKFCTGWLVYSCCSHLEHRASVKLHFSFLM
jgi:hypothetical protein